MKPDATRRRPGVIGPNSIRPRGRTLLGPTSVRASFASAQAYNPADSVLAFGVRPRSCRFGTARARISLVPQGREHHQKHSRENAMPVVMISILIPLLVPSPQHAQSVIVHITTSDAIDYARKIARDEGFDVTKTNIYSFDQISASEGKPFVEGYTTVSFDINASPENVIVISNSTGQAIDYNTCEIFDYPDLRPFQGRMVHLSNARKKTAQELADDVGCTSPKVLSKPVPLAKVR
jgi:hypothetical protein